MSEGEYLAADRHAPRKAYNSLTTYALIALCITVLRIFYLTINHRNLDVEEGQYWTWSQHLAFGYHSKPPLISWIIYLSTQLFGNSEAAIRVFSPLVYFASSLFIYATGKILYNRTIGFWSAITFLLVPGVTYSATIISTDPLLILFWSFALFAFTKAVKTGNIRYWIWCGVAIGFGLLSKYTMLVFLLSAALYLLLSPQYRSTWRKAGPWLAIFIAALLIAPNIIWNLQHHNAAIHHVVSHNIDLKGWHWHGKNLALFFASQLGLFGPVLLIAFIVGICHLRSMNHPESAKLLLCFAIPMLLLVIGEALLSRAYTNWAAVAYPSATIFVVAYLWQRGKAWLMFSNGLHILAMVVFFIWELTLMQGLHHWPVSATPNWQHYGASVQHWHERYPHSEYLVVSRELWSKSLYYGKASESNLFVWNPKHTINWIDSPLKSSLPLHKNFIFITHSKTLSKEIIHDFQSHKSLDSFTVTQRLQGREDPIYIYLLQDFKGY